MLRVHYPGNHEAQYFWTKRPLNTVRRGFKNNADVYNLAQARNLPRLFQQLEGGYCAPHGNGNLARGEAYLVVGGGVAGGDGVVGGRAGVEEGPLGCES